MMKKGCLHCIGILQVWHTTNAPGVLILLYQQLQKGSISDLHWDLRCGPTQIACAKINEMRQAEKHKK